MKFKQVIKKILKITFKPLAFKLGFSDEKTKDVVCDQNYSIDFAVDNLFSLIELAGVTPKHIVDVGANSGSWTRRAQKHFPNCRYTLIEPQEKMRLSVQDILGANRKNKLYSCGAGSREGSFKFTIHERDDSCSFAISEDEAKQRGLKQIEVDIKTLNQIISEENLPIPEIIKIDAEGLDLDVLKGANNLLGHTEVVLVEAGVVNKLIDNNIHDVICQLEKDGYRLFEITDINRPFGNKVLWLVELVFVKKGGKIDSFDYKVATS